MLNAGTNSEKYCLNHETAQGTQTHENTHTVNGAERPISGWQGTVQGGDGGRESGREALGGGRTEMVFCAVGGKLQDLTFLAFFPCDDEEVVDEEEPGNSGFCRPARNMINGQINLFGLARMMWMGLERI